MEMDSCKTTKKRTTRVDMWRRISPCQLLVKTGRSFLKYYTSFTSDRERNRILEKSSPKKKRRLRLVSLRRILNRDPLGLASGMRLVRVLQLLHRCPVTPRSFPVIGFRGLGQRRRRSWGAFWEMGGARGFDISPSNDRGKIKNNNEIQ